MQLIFDETSAAVSSSLGMVTGTMDTVLVVNQLDIGTLPVAILTSVRAVVQLYVLHHVEFLRLMTSCYPETF